MSEAVRFADHIRYAVWLIPTPAQERWWQRWITRVAKRFDGHPLQPHVTLTSGLVGKEWLICQRFLTLARGSGRLKLTTGALKGSEAFFQALFITVSPSPALLALRQRIRRAGHLPEAPYTPHLSLYYGHRGSVHAADLRREIPQTTWPPLVIDRIALWRISADPADWRPVALRYLAPP